MEEFNLKDLFVRQKRLVSQKEELAKSSSRVITLKLSYPLIRILFFYKNLCYKRSVDENLNKKVRIGFWCKWLNSLWNSPHSLGCGRANYEILHFVQNDAPLCHPEFISGSNRLRGLKSTPSILLPKNGNTTTGFFGRFAPLRMTTWAQDFSLQECPLRMTNPICVVPSLFLSRSVIQRLSISRASRAYPSPRHPEPFLRRISLFIWMVNGE